MCAKAPGYETHIIDLNIRAFHEYQNDWAQNKKLPFRLWDPSASWHWLGNTYMKDIHPLLEPLLSKAVDEILDMKPDIVGFSIFLYQRRTNKVDVSRIKKTKP